MITYLTGTKKLILPYYNLYEDRRMQERRYALSGDAESPKAARSRLINAWGPVVVWALLMFYWSSIPDLKSGLSQDFVLRKIAHITEYFILTFFLFRAMNEYQRGIYQFAPLGPIVIALAFAAFDEFHQMLVPSRHGSAQDVLIDLAGILSCYLVIGALILTHKEGARWVAPRNTQDEPDRRRVEMLGARYVYSESLPVDETKTLHFSGLADPD